jgi:tryptophanyl-tRNA synthetase
MAADILLYRATHVPVGDDQKQHLELSRDIAQKFNIDFSDRIKDTGRGVDLMYGDKPVNAYFPVTEPLIGGPAPRVMSLRDGTKKMSKSDPSDLSRINMTDDTDTIAKKMRKAKTDTDPLPSELDGLEGRPEADNLVGIFAALTDRTKADVLAEYGGKQFSEFKPLLTEVAVDALAPINAEMRRLMDNPDHIDAILKDGGERAGVIAEKTMNDVKDIIGFLRF